MSETLDHRTTPLADISQTPRPAAQRPADLARTATSKEFARKEWDKVWTKTWQIAGVARQLAKPGDYITTTLGPEVILCVRGDDGQTRAFYNVCQHRGMLLMDKEQGHTRRLTCQYHGWAYDLKGVLKVVPDEADFLGNSPCGKANLVEIPCESWAGFVWYNMDPDCVSLRSYMQPIADQIDTYPMDDMVRTHWVTLEGDFNWKLVQDNFNESYHVPFVHPQTKFVMEYAYDNSQFDLYPSGHCRMLMPGGGADQDPAGRRGRHAADDWRRS